ncbi:MAG: enoyl-CoA hydratase/isomerase family protein [Bdellovibrionales bacterium]|nr:enoyl-CoA hydratase/isomerase family protein [Bdellovibrionales bacterium]
MNSLKSSNAFDIDMAEELSSLISKEKPSSLILSHKGPNFCAGGNLHFYKKLKTKEEGLSVNQRIKEVLDHLFELEIPKACFVDGPCYGGGIELVSCFDYVVASPRALFGMWQRRIGLSFGWGGGSRLLHRMSLESLQQWLNQATTVSSYEAQKRGLVDVIKLRSKGIPACIDWVAKNKAPIKKDKLIYPNEADEFASLWMSEKHKSILERF